MYFLLLTRSSSRGTLMCAKDHNVESVQARNPPRRQYEAIIKQANLLEFWNGDGDGDIQVCPGFELFLRHEV